MYTTPRASPTLATSDTHAREPRQSALSTCLPLRPSNYQSEGLRCPAARSVSTVQRAMAERERERAAAFCTPATARRSNSIKLLIFSTRKFIDLLNLQCTIHPLHIKFLHGPSSRIVGEDFVKATLKKPFSTFYAYFRVT